jgi:hypothetical protein
MNFLLLERLSLPDLKILKSLVMMSGLIMYFIALIIKEITGSSGSILMDVVNIS